MSKSAPAEWNAWYFETCDSEDSSSNNCDIRFDPARYQLFVLHDHVWEIIASSTQHESFSGSTFFFNGRRPPPLKRGERTTFPLLQHEVPRRLELLWLFSTGCTYICAGITGMTGAMGRERHGVTVMLTGQLAVALIYAAISAWYSAQSPPHWTSAGIFLFLVAKSVIELHQVIAAWGAGGHCALLSRAERMGGREGRKNECDRESE